MRGGRQTKPRATSNQNSDKGRGTDRVGGARTERQTDRQTHRRGRDERSRGLRQGLFFTHTGFKKALEKQGEIQTSSGPACRLWGLQTSPGTRLNTLGFPARLCALGRMGTIPQVLSTAQNRPQAGRGWTVTLTALIPTFLRGPTQLLFHMAGPPVLKTHVRHSGWEVTGVGKPLWSVCVSSGRSTAGGSLWRGPEDPVGEMPPRPVQTALSPRACQSPAPSLAF